MRRLALLSGLALLATMLVIPAAQAEDHVMKIGEVQGAGHVSPFVGQEVTVSGVVTAVAFNGYYVQDGGDGNAATSDGLFVFKTGSKPVVVIWSS